MILHAIVSDAATAGWAARHGASVVQLRLKQVTTAERVRVGRELIASVGDLAMIVMNDDVAAAEALGVTLHLGQGDPGVERATRAGISFGPVSYTHLRIRADPGRVLPGHQAATGGRGVGAGGARAGGRGGGPAELIRSGRVPDRCL